MEESKLIDIWERASPHTIVSDPSDLSNEELSNSEVDGVHILAKARGPAFFPDTESGNGVFYSREAWDNAIANDTLQQRLNDRLIFGTIGHEGELDDVAIREGKFSHIITDLWIEDGVGMAEYLIYNTEPGRTLNMLLRTNSKLRVSTKARGKKLPITSRTEVDPRLFFLTRIDFVIDPGYSVSGAEIIESKLDPQGTNLNENEEHVMDGNPTTEKLIQVLESRISELGQDNSVKSETIGALQTQLHQIQESAAKTQADLTAAQEELISVNESLSAYHAVGTVKEFSEAKTKVAELNDKLTAFEESQDTDKAEVTLKYEEAQSQLTAYHELGTVDEIVEMIESADRLADEFINNQLQNISEATEFPIKSLMTLKERGFSVSEIEDFVEGAKCNDEEMSEEEKEEDEEEEDKKEEDEEEEVSESKINLSSKLFSGANKHLNSFEESTQPSKAANLTGKLLGATGK